MLHRPKFVLLLLLDVCLLANYVDAFVVGPSPLQGGHVPLKRSSYVQLKAGPKILARSNDSPANIKQQSTSEIQPEETTPNSRETLNELEELQLGYQEIVSLEAFDATNLGRLWTVEDIIGIGIHVPLLVQAFQTAIVGQIDPSAYAITAACTAITSLAHAKMCWEEPRDLRAPRLGEAHSVYEFSALYLVPFSWLLYRMTPLYPSSLEVLDVVGCLALSIVTIYGWAGAVYGKYLLDKVNDPTSNYQGSLQPSSQDLQTKAHLYLTGNVIINSLACLFLPFAWTLALRGTEWWTRVQSLHPHQAAFLGVSILVAILGDTSGNLLLRLQQLQLVTSPRALVVMGIVSNIVFLLVPEIVFNSIYMGGVSEVGFYWE